MELSRDYLESQLKKYFGFSFFKTGQLEIIQRILSKENVLAVMPTGSGKSLCYQLPALLLPGTTLVISPLIALMKDQVESLHEQKLTKSTFINSTLSSSEVHKRLEKLKRNFYKLVYIAPERLRRSSFIQTLKDTFVSLLVIDEAHCISEWGHDFRPDYLFIKHAIASLNYPPVLALTATATPFVQKHILELLGLKNASIVIVGFDRPNLTFEVKYTPNEEAKLAELRYLFQELKGMGIVYTGTRRESEEVAYFLSDSLGVKAAYYHAGLSDEERTKIQSLFKKEEIQVVVATIAFGMGIDKANLRYIIHYTMPSSIEQYYQEAGRAGRDGLPARCILLYSYKDSALAEWKIKQETYKPGELLRLYSILKEKGKPESLVFIAFDELEQLTGFDKRKIEVGISELEKVNLITRLPDKGNSIGLELHPIPSIQEIKFDIVGIEKRMLMKLSRLKKMVYYAETNQCRRQIILNYFGERKASIPTNLCCDNCFCSSKIGDEIISDLSIFPILEAVKNTPRAVGITKLAQILSGSTAKSLSTFGYVKSPYYGVLSHWKQKEIVSKIEKAIRQGYFKIIGGKYPCLALTTKGNVLLNSTKIDKPQIKQDKGQVLMADSKKVTQRDKNLKAKYYILLGLQELSNKLTRSMLAKVLAGVSDKFIYRHGFEKSKVYGKLADWATEEIIKQIDELMAHGKITFGYGRLIKLTEDGKKYLAELSEKLKIKELLITPYPMKLPDKDFIGYFLDYNSKFDGKQWIRTEIGELVYQFKFQNKQELIPVLLGRIINFLSAYPEFQRCEVILPVPPTVKEKVYDPVTLLAQKLSERLGLPCISDAVEKTKAIFPMKDMETLSQKEANIKGAFLVTNPKVIFGKRILILDDLYDSGATLRELTKVLKSSGAKEIFVLVLTKTVHTAEGSTCKFWRK